MESAIGTLFVFAIIIFSVVIHEVSHGAVANALGDPTAKYAGRLTLNPFAHLDPIGSVLVPIVSFVLPQLLGGTGVFIGWAKPVPYNPNYLQVRSRELGSAIVGAAGPLANIAVAVVFGLLIRGASFWAPFFGGAGIGMLELMGLVALVNLWLAAFNLLPIPPLDGSKVLFYFFPAGLENVKVFLEHMGFFLILFLIFLAPQILQFLGLVVRMVLVFITGGLPGAAW